MSSPEPPTRQPTAQPSPPTAGLVWDQSVPGGTLSALGGLLIVLGSGLPWYTGIAWGTPYIISGIGERKGILTLALGVLAILLGVSHLTAPRLPTLLERSSIAIGIGIVTGIVVVYDCLDFTGLLGLLLGRYGIVRGMTVDFGLGIWSIIVGAILAIAGGLLIWKAPKS